MAKFAVQSSEKFYGWIEADSFEEALLYLIERGVFPELSIEQTKSRKYVKYKYPSGCSSALQLLLAVRECVCGLVDSLESIYEHSLQMGEYELSIKPVKESVR